MILIREGMGRGRDGKVQCEFGVVRRYGKLRRRREGVERVRKARRAANGERGKVRCTEKERRGRAA